MSDERTIPYHELPGLEFVYLEDSWVLDVYVHYRIVTFILDLVLAEEHRLYSPPLPHEAYCYRKAELIFDDVSEFRWSNSGYRPVVDATGEVDYGNIDYLVKCGD